MQMISLTSWTICESLLDKFNPCVAEYPSPNPLCVFFGVKGLMRAAYVSFLRSTQLRHEKKIKSVISFKSMSVQYKMNL